MDQLIENLRAIVGRDGVLADADELIVYECDGLPQHKYRPRAVVFPSSTEATAEILRLLAKERVPFTPRGAGTGLSGGALALTEGVVIELARMRQILRVDPHNRLAVVQTGVVNAHVSMAAAPFGLHYVPDPSSNSTCTIGGNIAENAGGIHCLKYGTTTDHVLAARVVLSSGAIIDLGGGGPEQAGYDLLGIFVGSEGTFGIATEATLRLVPVPPAVRTLLADFLEVNDASHAVSAIIAAGVMPAALEMMDHAIIQAVEASVFAAGLPIDAGAALLIELDGIEADINEEAERVKNICLQQGARTCRLARDDNERKKLWAARKGAFGAIGRIAPDSMIQDAVVPRSRLPEVLADVYRIAAKYQLRIANVFHAGDGNLHPLICFDSRSPDEVRNVKEAGRELMETCVRAGGSISGEHGVGFDKRELLPLIFSDDDMEAMLQVRAAFDPLGLMNPGKIIPLLRGCGEGRAVASLASNGDGDRVNAAPILPMVLAENSSAAALNSPTVSSQKLRYEPSAFSTARQVAPSSTEEFCEVMRHAFAEKLSVVPAGAGTWLEVGNRSRRTDLVLQTTRLHRIIEHEPADLIASAEAGVTLHEFNSELAKRGQWLPLDPPDDLHSTLGGIIATGLAGPQRYGYGPPRAFVIGMQFIRADGRTIKAGGRVVKNVAGYDLCKLLTGSYGTLGLITRLTFKLRPLPEMTRTVIAYGTVADLICGAQCLIESRLFPVAIELLSPELANTAEFSNGKEAVLLIRFADSETAIDYLTSRAIDVLKSKSGWVGPLKGHDAEVWRILGALPLRFSERCIWRASVNPTDLGGFLGSLKPVEDHPDVAPRMWHASVADGRVRVIEAANIDTPQLVKALQNLRVEAQSLGGSLIIETAAADIKSRIDAWGDLGARGEVMRRIKQQLDPDNLLSPGRFAL
ncbi:MAG: D-lactate dehydrogenase (cytochrome) [Acidobacteria bacterium]|nr:D-lactate dehydrogenase (cytochrome) [Acidobacteriota bacterium]